MIPRIRLLVAPLIAALGCSCCLGERAAAATGDTLALVPTFDSVGAYVRVPGGLAGLDVALEYRVAGTAPWHAALAPVACAGEHEYRGSIVRLQPDTAYEVRARIKSAERPPIELSGAVRTWAEQVRIDREIVLPAGRTTKPLVIREQGRAGAWIRYRAAPGGTVIDVGTGASHAVVLDHAAYVIVEGLTVRGGTSDAVCLTDSHDVRVRGCDISGWGDPGRWGYYSDAKHKQWAYLDAAGRMIDHQEGVRVQGTGSTRVVVERNLIHHPRGTANCWAFQHPHGPEGVVLSETGGNNVVRDNDIIAGDGHRWNDAIASEYNGHVTGGPYRDTDISGNLLVGANDDGVELDGGQMNVRFWDNRIDGGLCGVSCAPNLRGPSYVFRNVIVSDGDERGACGVGFKMGGDPGVTFLLNNTVYVGNFGLTSGHYGKNPSEIISRNNVFAGPAPGLGKLRCDRAVVGDLDHDLVPPGGLVGTDALRPGREGAAQFGLPAFVAVGAGDFRLQQSSPGRHAGVAVPTIADAGEDLGAVAAGSAQTWPLRAGAPSLAPARAELWVREGSIAEQRFTLSTVPAGIACDAHGGESWTTCELGRETDAGTRTLTCRVDATGLESGPHRSFVSLRTGDGRLRSVPVVVNVLPQQPIVRTFEAEALASGTDFETDSDAAAQGGAYVRVVSAASSKPLACVFDVPADGGYFVLAHVRAAGPLSAVTTQDALNFRIDGGATMAWKLFGVTAGAWTWVHAAPEAQVNGRFNLAAGRHRLEIRARAVGAEIDAIAVANAPYPPPAFAAVR